MNVRIQAPTNVITVNGDEKTRFIFESFVAWAINGDRRFNTDGPGIRASVRIEREVAALTPIKLDQEEQTQRSITLSRADWELLRDALTSPQQMNGAGYPLAPARVLLPWIDAVENSTPVTEE